MGESMTANRGFGLAMVILGGLLLSFVATGALTPAPLILIFGGLGGLGAVLLGLWIAFGKY
jgi:hypothetical protein